MTRIRIVASAVPLVLATSLAAPLGASAQSAPIKIGFLAPLTGPFAQIGKDMVNGNQLYLAEIGGQVAGRKIEVLVEDDEGNPATALNKSRKLVEQDKISILTGGMLANVGYALQPYIDAQKIPTTYPVIADAVLALFTGRLALQFVKQYEEAGLKGKLPLLGGGTITDETVLPQMGDEALGLITALHYSQALDNPANAKFSRAFEASAGKIASYYSEATYTNARWIVEAIKAVGGKAEDRDALLAALRRVDLKG